MSTNVIDKRGRGDRSSEDRARFIRRYKKRLKSQVDRIADRRSIDSIANSGADVALDPDDLREPSISYDSVTSSPVYVGTGNDDFSRGDSIDIPNNGSDNGPQAGNSGEGMDEFSFTLTKEEFMDIYFSDMELPNFVKESVLDTTNFIWKRAGKIKQGIPSRLNLLHSFKNAMARRKIEGEDSPFLIEDDLRYDHVIQELEPIRHAVMFALMDVSFSMSSRKKDLAKRFFMLLYLFLHRDYEAVTIHFIRHTQEAEEVDEETFFYDQKTGGTVIASALELTCQIIEEKYNLQSTNIYVVQASDGEDFLPETSTSILVDRLLPIVQYYVYVEASNSSYDDLLYARWKPLADKISNFNVARLGSRADVYPALQELFKKK